MKCHYLDHDPFEQTQRQKVMKKTYNQMANARRLTEEVQKLISNLPSSRKHASKSSNS